jgi:hypothetical protein
MLITRAIPANMESISVSFNDGRRGSVRFEHLLRDVKFKSGLGVLSLQGRWDTLRPSANGDALEFDTWVLAGVPQPDGTIRRTLQQAPDETISIPAELVSEYMDRSDSGHALLHFQIIGQYGPMTLTFKPLGRCPTAPASITSEMALKLTQEQVQEWYTSRGWPKAGVMHTDYRGQYCGQFQLM